jgi:hypothetical protein
MFTLIVVLTSACYIAAIYYAFTAHSLTKAFAIVSGSTTLVACAIAGFIKVDPKPLTQNDFRVLRSHPYVSANEIKFEPEIDYLNVIQSKDINLSNIQTKQWNEGNYLWILDGTLQNNSQFPINSFKLELILSDCGSKVKKGKCLSSPESIFIEVTDLNIKPHEKGQFNSTYAVQDPNHFYKFKTSFISANSVVKKMLVDNTKNTNILDMNSHVDRMVICGGDTSIDEPEYDRRQTGKTILAKNREDFEQHSRGC